MSPNPSVKSKSPTAAEKQFDFLINVLITAIVRNKAGIEERRTIETVFQLDAVAAEKPWFVLRNFLVPQYLNQKLGAFGSGWVKIYEIKILKLVNRKNPNEVDGIPLRVMSFEQMELYCQKWEYPIKPRIFHSPEVARQYIALFEEDPAGYDVQFRKYVDGLTHKHPEMNDIRQNTANYIGDSEDLTKEFESLNQTKAPVDAVAPKTEAPKAEESQAETPAPAAKKGKKKAQAPDPAEPVEHTQTVGQANEQAPAADDPFSAV